MGLQEELIAALDAQRVVTGADELRRHGTDEGWHAAGGARRRRLPARHRGGRRGRPDLPRPRDADRPVRRRDVARGPRRGGRRRRLRRHHADGQDPAALGRGHGRHGPGRRDAPSSSTPSCAPRACSSPSIPAPTRRSAGWSRPARPEPPASATGRCARTSSASPSSRPTARSCGHARARASPPPAMT